MKKAQECTEPAECATAWDNVSVFVFVCLCISQLACALLPSLSRCAALPTHTRCCVSLSVHACVWVWREEQCLCLCIWLSLAHTKDRGPSLSIWPLPFSFTTHADAHTPSHAHPQVEEISAAIYHHKQEEATQDPMEKFCEGNEDADECRVFDT